MIDLDLLEKHELTQENLEKWFALDPLNLPPGKRSNLIHRVRSRVQEGMSRNFAEYKLFHALDQAWNAPFRQTTSTLVQQFIDSNPTEDACLKAANDWGLTHLIQERPDPKTGQMVKSFSLPTFFHIVVPLVQAYVKIRWAKIMNDRRLTPLFKFEPTKMTQFFSSICEALTDRVQVMSNQYGYYDVMKQAVLKMLHYSRCFQFPRTEWHKQEQRKKADAMDVLMEANKADSEEKASEEDEITVVDSEGIYYHLPHPTRTFYDLAHGPYTLNYGTHGCEYAGYWRIVRYREIMEGDYWNKDRIALGTMDLIGDHRLFFNSVYTACTLKMPTFQQTKKPDAPQIGAEVGLGTSSMDRERQIANLYYGVEHGDQGVLTTEYFERLIPSENDMGTYDQPVWFRFSVAGDGATILYATPLPYSNPVIYYGYDADESRTQNTSLSLEVLPFQDHFSNLLTQTILTCKQNLANITFLDEDQLMTGDENQRSTARNTIDSIRNMGEGLYRTLNIFTYSSKKMQRMQLGRQGIPDVAQTFNLPKGNVQEIQGVMREMLDVLERVLVMSSQEIAQAASHELRVDEVRNIAASTSSRLLFTATPVDIARDAWKRQVYQGIMAYGDPYIWVHLPNDTLLTEEQLKAMGFTFHHDKLSTSRDRFRLGRIPTKNTAIPLWMIANQRDGDDRQDNQKLAQGMLQYLSVVFGNPMLMQAMGPDQAIQWMNYVGKLAGFPRDSTLRNTGPSTLQEQQAQAQEQIKQLIDVIMPQVHKEMETELEPLLAGAVQNNRELQLLFRVLNIPMPHPANDSFNAEGNNGNGAPANPRMAAPAGGAVVSAAP